MSNENATAARAAALKNGGYTASPACFATTTAVAAAAAAAAATLGRFTAAGTLLGGVIGAIDEAPLVSGVARAAAAATATANSVAPRRRRHPERDAHLAGGAAAAASACVVSADGAGNDILACGYGVLGLRLRTLCLVLESSVDKRSLYAPVVPGRCFLGQFLNGTRRIPPRHTKSIIQPGGGLLLSVSAAAAGGNTASAPLHARTTGSTATALAQTLETREARQD